MSAAEQIAALQAAFLPKPRIFEGEETDPAVAAWNRRQRALCAIEASGTFYGCNSADDIALFCTLEDGMRFVEAQTLHGILAKLWVALGHFGPTGHRATDRADHDAVRRADTGEVAGFISAWDFGEEVLFGAILDIERALQFERVGYKGNSLAPPKREAE